MKAELTVFICPANGSEPRIAFHKVTEVVIIPRGIRPMDLEVNGKRCYVVVVRSGKSKNRPRPEPEAPFWLHAHYHLGSAFTTDANVEDFRADGSWNESHLLIDKYGIYSVDEFPMKLTSP